MFCVLDAAEKKQEEPRETQASIGKPRMSPGKPREEALREAQEEPKEA